MSLFSILGTFIFYEFANSNFVLGGYGILFSFVAYCVYSFVILYYNIIKSKQEILVETLTLFSIFLFPLLAYGFMILDGIYGALLILMLFAFLQLFNFVRNWSDGIHHSKGFPLVLHGLFFPFTLFVIEFFNLNFREGIMVLYFIITSMLSLSSFNFIKYQATLFGSSPDAVDEEVISSIPTIQGSAKTESEEKHFNKKINEKSASNNELETKKFNEDESKTFKDTYSEEIDEEDERFFSSLNKL